MSIENIADAKENKVKDDSMQVLGSILDKLPKLKRDMLLMRYYENLSYREIGSYFKCKENSARMTIERAVQFLRNEIKKKESVTNIAFAELFCLDPASISNFSSKQLIFQNSLLQQSFINGVQKMVFISKLKSAIFLLVCFTISVSAVLLADGEKAELKKTGGESPEVVEVKQPKNLDSRRAMKDLVITGICSKMPLDSSGNATRDSNEKYGILMNMNDDPITKGFSVWVLLVDKMNGQKIDFKNFEGKQVIAKGKGFLEKNDGKLIEGKVVAEKGGENGLTGWEAAFTELISLELKQTPIEKPEENRSSQKELTASNETTLTPVLKDITIVGVLTTASFSDITYNSIRQPTQAELDDFKWYLMEKGGGLLTVLPHKGIPKEFEYKNLEGELVILKGKGFDELTKTIEKKYENSILRSGSKKGILVTRVESISSLEIFKPSQK